MEYRAAIPQGECLRGEYAVAGNPEEPQKRGRNFFRPLLLFAHRDPLHELPDKKLVDLLRAFQRLAVDHQYRNGLRAGERDQFLFLLRVFPKILFSRGKRRIVVRMFADTANILDIFKLVVRANDEDGAREHTIERAT